MGGMGGQLRGSGFFFKRGKCSKIDASDGYTTLQMYYKPQDCTLYMAELYGM